jgi:hypothetical protein
MYLYHGPRVCIDGYHKHDPLILFGLKGDIPWSSILKMRNLEAIFLQDNQLTGGIPPSIKKLHALRLLRLSKNKLCGNLPEYMGTSECLPKLNSLYVDQNYDLAGEICLELMMKPGVSLNTLASAWTTSRKVSMGILLGISVAPETLHRLLASTNDTEEPILKVVNTAERIARTLIESVHTDKKSEFVDTFSSDPHRCAKERRGSQVFHGTGPGASGSSAKNAGFEPWQRIWMDGLEKLGRSGKPHNIFVVSTTPGTVYE